MELINKAKEHLILYHPFFAYLALQIEFVEDYAVEKSSIDGITFRYNPKYVKTLDHRTCAALIAHAMSHVLLLHPLRAEHKNPKRWDAASDYAVNQILKESNIPILNEYYKPEYKGLATENIYEILEDSENENNKNSGNNSSSPDSGNDSSAGQGDSNDSGDENTNEKVDESNTCEVWSPDNTQSAHEQEAKMTQKIMDAAMQTQSCGDNLSQSIKEIVNGLKEPKKDWRELLMKFTAEISRNDYNWEMPDLVYLQRNIYIPSLYNLEIGKVIFAIDTSASVNNDLLKEFLSELREASEMLTEEITVIHCDTKVRKVEQVQTEDIENIVPEGRGGTSFLPVFNYVEENDLNPVALIYFTDGMCFDTLVEPGYQVLWCIYGSYKFNPKFGEVINVDK